MHMKLTYTKVAYSPATHIDTMQQFATFRIHIPLLYIGKNNSRHPYTQESWCG